jgi:hypothetical protein
MLCLAVDEHLVGELDAVPAAVAVHREIAPGDRTDPATAGCGHPLFDRGEKLGPRMWRRIAPVGEGVQHEVVDAQGRPELDQRA